MHSPSLTQIPEKSRLRDLAGCLLSFLALAAASATVAPIVYAAESTPRIITLGDSITKGARPGVRPEETFAALLQIELRKQNAAAEVINVGIGGERTDQALTRLAKGVIARKPEVVTIMYGTNDSYVDKGKSESRLSVDVYKENLGKLVDELRAANIIPVLMTEPRWGRTAGHNGANEHPNVRLEKYVAACREVAQAKKVPLVDHFRIWTEREAKGTDIGSWTTDQCHPNPEGHRILNEAILPVVREALQSAQKRAR